jgi:hypothetical protein
MTVDPRARAATSRWRRLTEHQHELRDERDEIVGYVRLGRGGWDQYSLRTGGYLGAGASGDGPEGLARAKAIVESHAADL